MRWALDIDICSVETALVSAVQQAISPVGTTLPHWVFLTCHIGRQSSHGYYETPLVATQ